MDFPGSYVDIVCHLEHQIQTFELILSRKKLENLILEVLTS